MPETDLELIQRSLLFDPVAKACYEYGRRELKRENDSLRDIIRECFQTFPNPDGPDKGWLEHFYKHPTPGANLNYDQAELLRKVVER